MDTLVLQVGEGRKLSLGDVQMIVQEDGTRTRGVLGVAEFVVAPHARNTPPPHLHHAHEEGFYILEGELEFRVGMEKVYVSRGGFVMVPIGAAHTFSNPTDKTARFLNTFTPPRYLGYFEEMSQFLHASTPPSREQLAMLMERYETEVVSL